MYKRGGCPHGDEGKLSTDLLLTATMLKNLSVAAILLAAAIANASDVTNNVGTSTIEADQFDTNTIKNTLANAGATRTALKRAASSSTDSDSDSSDSSSTSSSGSSSGSSSDSSDSDSGSSSDSSSSSSSTSSSSSESDSSSSDTEKKSSKSKKSKAVKAFKKSHGKKWLKSEKVQDIEIRRNKSKFDSKGKKLKHAKKSKYASVKNSLKLKSKKPIMITVNDNNIKKGLTITDNGSKLFKTPKTSYAIVEKGTHNVNVVANKKGKKGTATIKVQEVKLSKKIAGKYKIVSSAVQYKDAQDLCERFGGQLAEVKEKDIKKIVKAAEKLVKKGFNSLWIDRVVGEEDEVDTYLPTVLNLLTSKAQDDPENQYSKITEYAAEQINAIKYDKKTEKKKYNKAFAKVEAKIRKYSDKYLDKTDKSEPRPVLCRVD